jgi:aspartyl-tRNA(Asn)/glutamyl-tRNA(Gln) amidotransferase subunit B
VRCETFHQRDKEEAHDYRYFPDPDLVVVEVDDAWLAEIKAQVPELPAARTKRYTEALGLKPADAAILSADRATGDFFEAVLAAGATAARACGLMETLREVAKDKNASGPGELGIAPKQIAEVAVLVQNNQIAASKETARQVIEAIVARNCSAKDAAQSLGLLQSSDTGAIDAAIDALFAANPPALVDYKAGKKAARGALIGMVMKNGKGLNAKLVGERLDAKLGI